MQFKKIRIAALTAIVLATNSNAESFHAHCRDYPPEIAYVESDCVGAVPDLITDIITELGHEIVCSKVPWVRSIKVARDGKVDLLIRHSMTPERELFLDAMPYAYYTRELSFYKSPSFTEDIKSYNDIKQHHVGAIRGNFYSPRFSALDTNILSLLGTTKQLVGVLERSRIDLAVTSSSHSEELFTDRFVKAEFVDSFYNPMFISVPKKSKAAKYQKDIANLLLEYRKSKRIDQYFKKYNLPVPKQIFE